MKKITILLFTLICTIPIWAQSQEKTISVTVENTWDQAKINEPIVIQLKEIQTDFEISSATVWESQQEIPSQLDDLDQNGIADELAFVTDIPAQSKKTFKITFSESTTEQQYSARVYAQMKLNDKGKKNPQIQYLSIPGTTNPKHIYSGLFHHGPAFESELVAYRIYFDNRQSIDIYGKRKYRLELAESNYYSSVEQKTEEVYGSDVLWAGTSVSVGSFRGWEDNQPQYINNVETRSEGILAYGPIRTIVEVKDKNWEYQGKKLNMTQHYILYAGHRDLQVQISFKEASVAENAFCTGVQKIEEQNIGFLQNDGLAGSWGVNLPEKTDTINNPRETVGLGVYVPHKFVTSTQEDETNYLIILNTNQTRSLNYYLTFCAAKEEEGYKDSNAWFAYLRQWQKTLENPCTITINK